jgi:hypothetical protein
VAALSFDDRTAILAGDKTRAQANLEQVAERASGRRYLAHAPIHDG